MLKRFPWPRCLPAPTECDPDELDQLVRQGLLYRLDGLYALTHAGYVASYDRVESAS
jgi:hypothetical protein